MSDQQKKRILISCAVIVVVSCICVGLVLGIGAGAALIWPINPAGSSEQPTPIAATESSVETDITEVPESENEPANGSADEITEELPEEWAEILDEIESQVAQVRGLEASKPVDRELISPDYLEVIVAEDFFSEYTQQDAYQDVVILSTLGLLPDDFDLLGFYNLLYSEQIAGFYDDEIEKIFVVKGSELTGSEKMTYAHEFTHVLQDQVYDLSEGLGLNEDDCEADSEKCAAVQALIEGDATQSELLWFQTYASRQDYLDLLKFYDSLESPALDSAPPYISADLYFPYEKGLTFVEYLFDKGGFDAIDEAYLNPPVSTEQILHPERYPDDVPVVVTLPELRETLNQGWTLLDQNVLGEWYTYLILGKSHESTEMISDDTALDAAEGWGGDAYAFYLNEDTDEVVFILDTVWDTPEDAEDFVEAFYEYASGRWSSLSVTLSDARLWKSTDGFIGFWHEGVRTIWVMAPDQTLLSDILSELQ